MSTPETLAAHVVTTLYQSQPEAAINEDGFEVQVATLASGETHSVVLFDHTDANMVEMPAEVAVAISWVLSERLRFEGETAFLQPPLAVGLASNARQHVSVYRSSPNPAMNEAGYELIAAVDADGSVFSVALHDHIGRDHLVMPAQIARSIAKSMAAFPLFPSAIVN